MSKKKIHTKLSPAIGTFTMLFASVDGLVAVDTQGDEGESTVTATQTTVLVEARGGANAVFTCLLEAIYDDSTTTLHDGDIALDDAGAYSGVFTCHPRTVDSTSG